MAPNERCLPSSGNLTTDDVMHFSLKGLPPLLRQPLTMRWSCPGGASVVDMGAPSAAARAIGLDAYVRGSPPGG